MKTKKVYKISIIVLALIMVCSILAMPLSKVSFAYAQETETSQKSLQDIDEMRGLKLQLYLEDQVGKWEKEQEEALVKEKRAKKDQIKATAKSVIEEVPNIVGALTKEDYSIIEIKDAILPAVTTVLNAFGPYGQGAAIVVNLLDSLSTIALGGEPAKSEIVKMNEEINLQFDEVKGELYIIEDSISDLSNQINSQTEEIVNKVTQAIDNAQAKENLRRFLIRSEGNFSYNQFRNYVIGQSEVESGNIYNNQAYYDSLQNSIRNDLSQEIIKENYDKLYSSLYSDKGIDNNVNLFYEYLIPESSSVNSIIRDYYDCVSARPDLLPQGTSPEYATIQFAYDLYQTSIMVDYITLICNNYQYLTMCFDGTNEYVYDKVNDCKITKQQIIDMETYMSNREEKLYLQLAKDLAYVMHLSDAYYTENEQGDVVEVINNNVETFANVEVGQTIYMGKMSEYICEMFDIDSNLFTFSATNSASADGSFVVDDYNVSSLQGKMLYKGQEVYSITFDICENSFCGGSGSEYDPYIITEASQFFEIANGLDKHYKLGANIDLNNETIDSIGSYYDKDSNYKYKEFTGSLDGNGYKISNLTIESGQQSGLFAKIGEGASVCNLILDNVTCNSYSDVEKSGYNNYYDSGIIAGINDGYIDNCKIINCFLTAEIETDTIGEQTFIYVQAGAVVGRNNYYIANCVISNTDISVESSHDIAGENPKANQTFLYVGGVCGENNGFIENTIVDADTRIVKANAEIVSNYKGDIYARIEVKAGGIAGKTQAFYTIENVFSQMDYIQCKAIPSQYEKNNYPIHKKYCSALKDQYVVKNYETDDVDSIKAESIDEVLSVLPLGRDENGRLYNVTYNVNEYNKIYKYCESEFRTQDLKISVNGKQVQYTILGVYGFDTTTWYNSDCDVKILFLANVNGKEALLTTTVNIKITERKVIDKSIVDLQPEYVLGEFSLDGIRLEYVYDFGPNSHILVSDIIDQLEDWSINENYGKQTLRIYYDGSLFKGETTFVCDNHVYSNNAIEDGERDATCSEIGCIIEKCETCGKLKYHYTSKLSHVPNYDNPVGYELATCQNEGFSGEINCKDCGIKLYDSEVLPKLQHEYVYYNSTQHKCNNCPSGLAYENHQYKVTECIIREVDKNGVETYKLRYLYTCESCVMSDGKHYSYHVDDTNIITEEELNLPTLMISDGYALKGGDKVVVYVQLINNPGINGANFALRYSEMLELVNVEDGTLLKSNYEVKLDNEVNYGYNFVWGNAEKCLIDGNLLKLTFRVNENAKKGEEYKISLGYSIDNGATGGFSVDGKKQCFITRDGSVSVVDHLPGDINSDNSVDLLDALEIGKYLVGKVSAPEEKYADVNLDGETDVLDMVAILQSITGGYGINLLNQEFKVLLNTNGLNIDLDELLVSVYGDNDTYAEAGLEDLVRDGYKFKGWYTQMFGGEKISLSDAVKYLNNQRKQTLYAQWELNELVFDGNTASNGYMPIISYSPTDGNITLDNKFDKEYEVDFINEKFEKNGEGTLVYELEGWQGSNGVFYQPSEIVDLKNNHFGRITLTAVWKAEPSLVYPNWTQLGYEEGIKWYTKSSLGNRYLITENKQVIGEYATCENGVYKVYAEFIPIEYELTINYNGGIDQSGNSQIIKNVTIEDDLSTDFGGMTLSKVGYKNTESNQWKDNSNHSYGNIPNIAQIIQNNSNNYKISLIKQWDPITYTITYNGNGADGGSTAQSTHTYNNSQALKPNGFTRIGYTFIGWAEYNPNNGVKYEDNATVKNLSSIDNGNVELYAKWQVNAYKITYNFNGGNGSVSSQTFNYGAQVSEPVEPTRTGYIFMGWSFDKSFSFSGTMPAYNIVATANWNISSASYDSGYSEKKIDASYTYDYDTFDISSLSVFFKNGYKIEFAVEIYMKEEDEGYQELYLINGNGSQVAGNGEFAHGGSGKDGWGWEYFTWTIEAENCTSTMKLRYGAHGKYSDDWWRARAIVKVSVIVE